MVKQKKLEEEERVLKAKRKKMKEVFQLQDNEDDDAGQKVVLCRPAESSNEPEREAAGQVRLTAHVKLD